MRHEMGVCGRWLVAIILGLTGPLASGQAADAPRQATQTGEMQQWHKVTITIEGPQADQRDTDPNPFTDYRLTATFRHDSDEAQYRVPGYFAADGNAAETSATSGNRWRVHFAPDRPGRWHWEVELVHGKLAAVNPWVEAQPAAGHGLTGSFDIAPSDKSGRDFRAHGRLQYVRQHYLRFAGSGEYFLKCGADAPETLLAYVDFDGTTTRKTPLKTWQPHVHDWQPGDPTWQGGKGKGLIGALNYLAGKGANAISFLTYSAGGDGDNVWPMVERNSKLNYHCAKLDQWQIVFDHAQRNGLYLHFKLQETENDDQRVGTQRRSKKVPEALDGGALGIERRLYLRELVARFGYALALNWNLGEENTQTPDEQRAMAQYLHDIDPYRHHIVIHTYPGQQDEVYSQLLGSSSVLTGASLQNGWSVVHQRTLKWVRESAAAGRPWVVANDEQNPADQGVPPDPGYEGFDGRARDSRGEYTLHDIRKHTLWGNLMAGGAGVEYYFGYKLPQNDLLCEDFRSRDRSWDYGRIAVEFFRQQRIPLATMTNSNALVGNSMNDNSRYCFAAAGELYLVYLPTGGTAELDLHGASGEFDVAWFNPRSGGPLAPGSIGTVAGGNRAGLGQPPEAADQDWLVVVRRRDN